MANGGQINYSIKFNTDKKDLDQLQKLLRDITVQAAMPGQEADKSLQQASVTAERLLGIINKSFNQDLGTINVTKFNEELTKGNLTIANVKKGLEGVKGGASAFNLLSSSILGANVQLKTTNALLDRMAVTLKNTIRYGISSSLYNNFVNSFAKAYDYVVDLDKSLNDIRIVTGLSAEKMETFAVNANSAAKNLGASTLDYTNAALIYYQQGLSDQEVKARAEATVKAANVTGQSGREVSEQLTAVWNGYKVTAEETELYVDKLAAVAASTAADLEELSTGMSKVASAANIMGVDIDQLNAQLATVVSVTRQAPESVGTAFKTIYARMGDIKAGLDDETTLGNYTAKMAELGFNVLDANNNLRDMGEVIEEIGFKWNEMSREQQVALTRTMGGARQYNQLLALFDNWDMYIDALETSKNAAGELQREQDIYMDSTDAHLKQLKATWQDLYDSLLNTKEINPLIDLFKDIVQSLDNFIDAFGGGANSIAAFGVVIANVFNKQISSAINNFLHNKTVAEQNMNAIALKQKDLMAGATASASQEGKISPYDEAIKAQASSQEAHARRIMEIQHGINEEKQKELIDMQNEIANLEKEAVLLEKKAEQELASTMTEEQYQQYLNQELATDDQIGAYWQDRIDKEEAATKSLEDSLQYLEKQAQYSQTHVLETEELVDIKKELNQLELKATESVKKELQSVTKNVDFNKMTLKEKEKILQIVRKIVAEQKKEEQATQKSADAAEQQRLAKEKAAGLRNSKENLEADFDRLIDQGQKALSTSEQVMVLTSSLASLTMAWGAMGSLVQTWTDENATLGDKITQTLTSLAFMLPTILTTYKNLKSIVASYNITKTKELALEQASTIAKQLSVKNMTREELILAVSNAYKENGISLTREEIEKRLILDGVIDANTESRVEENIAIETNHTLLQKVKTSQEALNKAMSAGTKAALGFVAAIAVISIVASAISSYREAMKENNDEIIKENKTKQEETKTQLANTKAFLDAYKAYQKGTAAKTDLAKAADNLSDVLSKESIEVAKLTGNYQALVAELENVQEKTLNDNVTNSRQSLQAAQDNLKYGFKEGQGMQYKDMYSIWDIGYRGFNLDSLANILTMNKAKGWDSTDEWAVEDLMTDFNLPLHVNYDLDSLLAYYDKAVEVIDVANRYLTEDERNNSELYKNMVSWVHEKKEFVETYREAEKDYMQALLEKEGNAINFNEIQSYDEWIEKRDKLIETLQKDEHYKDMKLVTLRSNVSAYAGSQNEDLYRIISDDGQDPYIGVKIRFEKDEAAVDSYRETVNKIIEEGSVGDKDEFIQGIETQNAPYIQHLKQVYGDNKYRSSNEYKELVLQSQQEAEDKNIAAARKNMSSLSLENIYTPEYIEDSKNTVQDIYKEVFGQDLPYDEIKEKLEKYCDYTADEYDKMIEELGISEDQSDNLFNILSGISTINIDEEKLQKEISQKIQHTLENMPDFAYELNLALKADLESDFDNILGVLDQMEKAAGYINEDYIVMAENVREVGEAYPGILENAKILADGSFQLNKESVQKSMALAQQDYETSKEATIKKLELQRDEVKAKSAAANHIADILESVTEFDQLNAEQQADIDDALNTLKGENTKDEAQYEKEASKDVADTGNQNASAMGNSFAQAYKKMADDSEKWAKAAKNNFKVATTGKGETANGYNISTAWSATNGSGIITTAEQKEAQNSQDLKASGLSTKDLAAKYREIAKQYDLTANSYQSAIAEIEARDVQFDKKLKNISLGKGADGGKNKNGNGKEAKTIDLTKNEVDRYHKVDTLIEKLSNNLDKLENSEEKAFGGDWVAILSDQLKNLNQQVDTYREKLQIARGEQSELRNELAKQGVQFNANGTVANYTQALNAQLAQLNALEAQYNSLSAAQQEQWDNNKIIDNAKESFATFKEHLDRYDELVSNFIPEIEKNLQDKIDKMVEKQIERFDKGIDLRLDMADAERDWNEFKTKVIDGIDEDDIIGQTEAKLRDFATYYNDASTGTIQALTKHLNDTMAQVREKISHVYGKDDVKEIEDLQKYYEELMEEMEDVFDLQKEIHENYLDMMDEAQDKFDEQIDMYQTVSDLIEHDMNLIELVYGEGAYSELAKFYDKQQENYKNQLDFQHKQVDFWKAAMDGEEEGSEAWENARDKWVAATSDFNDLIETSIENLQDKYVNAIEEIFDKLNDEVTKGKGLDFIDTEWQLINKGADQYLDTINQLFETQALENKYLDAIDNTDNLKAQKQLKEVMDEELTALREKDKLTKYDIDRANKRYEIALKQIALEEAQQNKSTMRLRRDSQGNYRYEYVADNDAIDKAKDELEKLKNDLYNFDKKQYKESLGEMYDTWVDYQDALKEAAQINDPEERAAKEALIKEKYGDIINGMLVENDVIRRNLEQSAFEDLAMLYDKNLEDYTNMTEAQKDELMGNLVPAWQSGIQDMIDTMVGEGGFYPVCEESFEKLEEAQDEFAEGFNEIQEAAKQSFEEIASGVDDVITQTTDFLQNNTSLIDAYNNNFTKMKNLLGELDNLSTKFSEVAGYAKTAAEEAHNMLQEINGENADAYDEDANAVQEDTTVIDEIEDTKPKNETPITTTTPTTSTPVSQPVVSNPYAGYRLGGQKYTIKSGDTLSAIAKRYYNSASLYTEIWAHNKDHLRGKNANQIWPGEILYLNTGGYTGDWSGTNGRIAMLHQKELVLNAQDTENMLNAISVMRNLTNSVGIATLARLASLGAGGSTGIGGNGLEQNVHISATFPNATSSREIEEALLNLTNRASQMVGRR